MFGGYIDNLNDTAAGRHCQFKVGDEFFTLNIKYSIGWRDAFILFSFFAFNVIVTISEYFVHFSKFDS